MPIRAAVLVLIAALIVGWGAAQEETPPPEAPTLEVVDVLPTPTPTPSPEPTLTPQPTLTLPDPSTSTPEPTLEPLPEMTPEPTPEATPEPAPETTPEPVMEQTAEPLPDASATPLVLPALPTTTSPTPDVQPVKDGKGSRVEAELLELAQALNARDLSAAQQTARDANVQVAPDGQRVRVELVARDASEALRLRPLLEGMGGIYQNGYDRYLEYDFPALRLAELDFLQGDYSVRRPRQAQTMQTGTNVTEGLYTMGADAYQRRGIRGQGVRIGIIDLGFYGLPSAETACVKSYQNFSSPGAWSFSSWDNHGTSVAEIVCDIAPSAEVYVAYAGTLSQLGLAVDWLLSLDVHIVTMSLSWNDYGAGDGTGEVNTIVKRATDNGVLWFTSAGNYNGYTWNGDWSATTINVVNLGNITAQNFGSTAVNIIGSLSCGARGSSFSYDVLLRWSDWNASRTGNASGIDLDLHVVTSTDNGTTWKKRASAVSSQGSPFVPPNERLYGAVTTNDTTCGVEYGGTMLIGVVVQRYTPAAPAHLQLIFNDSLPNIYSPRASIATPADSADVFAVAASEVKPHPGWGWSPQRYPDVAPYSSRGPAFGPGGTNPLLGGLPKPDLSAPTNVRTSRSNEFNGTSAASPHAAGLAALEFSNNLSYYTSLSGANRLSAFRSFFLGQVRPPRDSRYGECTSTPANCFGVGVAALRPQWTVWSDTAREETDHSIILTGVSETSAHSYRWTSQPDAQASGGRYALAYGRYPQAEFEAKGAHGVRIFYYRLSALAESYIGTMRADVFREGSLIGTYTITLNGPGIERIAWELDFEVMDGANFSYNHVYRVQLRPTEGSYGLSLDRVELIQPPALQEGDATLLYSGTWADEALAASSGGKYRQTNARDAGVRFFTASDEFLLYYTKRPDGGLMEVRVNGLVCTTCTPQNGVIDHYSGTTSTQAQSMALVSIDQGIYGPGPYVVTLVNNGRRSPGATGTVTTLDAVRIPDDARAALVAPPLPKRLSSATTAPSQEYPLALPIDGVWTRIANKLALGGFQWSTSTIGAQFVFSVDQRNLTIIHQNGLTGGQAEIWINGTLCAACGTIDMYAATTSTRNATSFSIPLSYSGPFVVSLRNSAQRNARSTGNFMVLERAEVLGGSFLPVPYLDASASNPLPGILNGTFPLALNAQWVQQASTEALYGEVAVNSQRQGAISLATTSRRFDLIVGCGPLGGRLALRIWNGAGYDTLATYDANVSGAFLARQSLPITIPGSYPGPSFNLLLEVLGNEQVGTSYNFVYLDGLLVLDNGSVTSASYAASQILLATSSKRLEVGGGWANVPNNLGTLANDYSQWERRTATAGASLQVVANSGNNPVLVFSRQPDGGIAEVWVNGVLSGEVSFYAPATLRRQWMRITMPAGTAYPALVEIRNTNRRTAGATGNFLYVDAVISEVGVFSDALPSVEDSAPNLNASTIQRIGTGWARQLNTTTRTVDASNGEAQTTTATDAAIRFTVTTDNFFYVRSLSTTGGLAEVWVNGQLCSACVPGGTISQYAPFAVFRAAQRVAIPAATFGPGPYTVEIRNTNRRPPGSTGNLLSIDALMMASGSILATDLISQTNGNADIGVPIYLNTWSSTSSAAGANGAFLSHENSFLFSIATNAILQFTANVRRVIIYRHVGTTGGTAQVYIEGDFCAECATINSYAPYTRYQVPYLLTIPDRYSLPVEVEIRNKSTRFTGSTGNSLQIDAFGVVP